MFAVAACSIDYALNHKLEIWNLQLVTKQNDPNIKIYGPEYQKKCIDLFYSRNVQHQDGKAIYYTLKNQLIELRKIKEESTNKYRM